MCTRGRLFLYDQERGTEGEFPDLARNIAEQINQMHCGKRLTGSGGKGVGYLCGTVTDYAFGVMKVPAALWKFDDTQLYDDCFAMFNQSREKHMKSSKRGQD